MLVLTKYSTLHKSLILVLYAQILFKLQPNQIFIILYSIQCSCWLFLYYHLMSFFSPVATFGLPLIFCLFFYRCLIMVYLTTFIHQFHEFRQQLPARHHCFFAWSFFSCFARAAFYGHSVSLYPSFLLLSLCFTVRFSSSLSFAYIPFQPFLLALTLCTLFLL